MIEEYKGWINLNDNEIADFYSGKYEASYIENQYLFCGSDVFVCHNGKYNRIEYPIISSSFGGVIKPRNIEQVAAIDMMNDTNSKIKLITGRWGSGKTMILAASAIAALEQSRFDRIVWVRNNVQVKDTDSLGAIPGTEVQKMLPYAMPLADHCGGIGGLEMMLEKGSLEIIPLGFLRGRSIRNSIIMCSEAENLTKEHLQLIMGRIDEGSELWIDGDTRQRDRVAFEKSRGIETMIDRLAGNELFGYVHLITSERSPAARLADLLDD